MTFAFGIKSLATMAELALPYILSYIIDYVIRPLEGQTDVDTWGLFREKTGRQQGKSLIFRVWLTIGTKKNNAMLTGEIS